MFNFLDETFALFTAADAIFFIQEERPSAAIAFMMWTFVRYAELKEFVIVALTAHLTVAFAWELHHLPHAAVTFVKWATRFL
ncbi:hypothetical protein [Brevibacillus sp. SYSU BS000544]|uniref:hypothetical protein n=1 Tax=Brevibacillus sp. SYSU BS000544 TaxID=3416443 RepID=UPI003CE560A8